MNDKRNEKSTEEEKAIEDRLNAEATFEKLNTPQIKELKTLEELLKERH